MTTKKKFAVGILLFLVMFASYRLYVANSSRQDAVAALREVVLADVSNVEDFLSTYSVRLHRWNQYLSISQLKSSLFQETAASKEHVRKFLVNLRFAYGVEKYPPIAALRDSLNELQKLEETPLFSSIWSSFPSAKPFLARRAGQPAGNFTLPVVAAAQKSEAPVTLEEAEEMFFEQTAVSLPSPPSEALFDEVSEENGTASSAQTMTGNEEFVASESASYLEEPQQSEWSQSSEQTHSNFRQMTSSENGNIRKIVQNSLPDKTTVTSSNEWVAASASRKSEMVSPTVSSVASVSVSENDPPEIPPLVPDASACEGPGNSSVDVLSPAHVSAAKRLPKISTFSQEESIPETVSVPEESAPDAAASKVSRSSDSKTENVRETAASEENENNSASVPESNEDLLASGSLPPLPFRHYTLQKLMDSVSVSEIPSVKNAESPQKQESLSVGDSCKILAARWMACRYTPPTEADLDAAYKDVREAAGYVNQLFAKSTPAKRQEWIRFLHWDVLHLNEPADATALEEIHRQLSCGAFGLELEFFVRLRSAIGRYLALEAQMQSPDAAEALFASAQKEMAILLLAAQKYPSSLTQRGIEDLLDWMDEMNQVSDLVTATSAVWAQPNVIVHMNQSVFDKYGSRLIEEEQAVNEQVRRATIRGTTLFNGNLSVRPVCNPDQIELGIVLDGASDSRTNAYAGPAIVSSRASSRIVVNKSVFIDQDGFDSTSAQVNIRTNSRIENVRDVYNRHLIESFATRRAFAQKDEMEQTARAQNAARLRRQFNQSIDEILENWNQRLAEDGKRQLAPRGLTPQTHMWSDDAGIHMQVRVACRDGFTAPTVAPQMNGLYDIQISVHESAFQGIFKGFFSGMNFNQNARSQFLATAPKWLQNAVKTQTDETEKTAGTAENAKTAENAESEKEWAMRFVRDWPVSTSFDDGKIVFCIHCQSMEYDGKAYPALNIAISYKIEHRGTEFVLVREGNVEILPPDFNPEVKKRLPSSMVSLRRVMSKRLEKIFEPEIKIQETRLLKDVKEDSRFANMYVQPAFLQAEDGWLQVGFNLSEKKPETP